MRTRHPGRWRASRLSALWPRPPYVRVSARCFVQRHHLFIPRTSRLVVGILRRSLHFYALFTAKVYTCTVPLRYPCITSTFTAEITTFMLLPFYLRVTVALPAWYPYFTGTAHVPFWISTVELIIGKAAFGDLLEEDKTKTMIASRQILKVKFRYI